MAKLSLLRASYFFPRRRFSKLFFLEADRIRKQITLLRIKDYRGMVTIEMIVDVGYNFRGSKSQSCNPSPVA